MRASYVDIRGQLFRPITCTVALSATDEARFCPDKLVGGRGRGQHGVVYVCVYVHVCMHGTTAGHAECTATDMGGFDSSKASRAMFAMAAATTSGVHQPFRLPGGVVGRTARLVRVS